MTAPRATSFFFKNFPLSRLYRELQVHNDATQRVELFSYYEANFLHAKTLAEKLDMRKEDLFLTFGLAYYAFGRSRTALAEERCQELAEKAQRYGDFDMQDRAYIILSSLARNPERQRFWAKKATDVWSGAEELSADECVTLGYNAERQRDFSAAEGYYKQALAILEREEDSRAINLYGVLGNFARQKGDVKTAEEWYQKEWQKAKELGKLNLQAFTSQCLGNIAAERGDAKEARKRYQEALTIYDALQDQSGVAGTLRNMGELLTDAGAYDAAKETLQESVRISERIGNVQLTAANYNALGKLSGNQEDFISAKLWFEKALSMLEAIGDKEIAAITRDNLELATAKEAARRKKEESP